MAVLGPERELAAPDLPGGLGKQRRWRADARARPRPLRPRRPPGASPRSRRATRKGRSSSSFRRRTDARQGSSKPSRILVGAVVIIAPEPMQSVQASLDRARSRPKTTRLKGRGGRGKANQANARSDPQRGSGDRRQGDHDRGHGAHHRQLRHLGRRRHAARLHRLDRGLGRRGEDLRPGISRRLRPDDPAISAPAAPPVHQRGGATDRPRPQRPAAAPERSGGRRGGAQARPQHFRRRLARDHHLEPGFPRQVRRLRSRSLRRRAARHGHDRARLRFRVAQAGAEAVHRRGAHDRHRRAEGRGHGGGRL